MRAQGVCQCSAWSATCDDNQCHYRMCLLVIGIEIFGGTAVVGQLFKYVLQTCDTSVLTAKH
jgi:hypothetical protein